MIRHECETNTHLVHLQFSYCYILFYNYLIKSLLRTTLSHCSITFPVNGLSSSNIQNVIMLFIYLICHNTQIYEDSTWVDFVKFLTCNLI